METETDNQAQPPPVSVSDVVVARKERAGIYMLLILVVIVVGDSRRLPPNVKVLLMPLVPAALIVGIDGIRYLYDRSGRRRLAAHRDRLISMTAADAEVLLAGLLEAGNTGMGVPAVHRISHRSLLSEACATMCQCGRVGTLFRFSQQADGLPEPPQPILIEFQPLPLPRGPNGRMTDRGIPIQGDADGTSTVEMAVQRQSATSGHATAIIAALVLLALVAINIVKVGLMPGLSKSMTELPRIALALGSVLGLVALLNWLHPAQWFAVPGAIVVRWSSWRAGHWQVASFDRSNSVMAHWPDIGVLAVASEDGKQFCQVVSYDVADFAIRAWLSPLEPPAAERLSDLT